MTPEQAFENYAVHGATVHDFADYVGQSVDWLAEQIADMDPDNTDPQQAAQAFMQYVADELAKLDE